MFEAYSQKLGPPFSGQIQIVESDTYRAMTLDGQQWEIQYVNRIHIRAATVTTDEIKTGAYKTELIAENSADPKLVELMDFLVTMQLPFAGRDHFEYWLLDQDDRTPLAMMYSCSKADQMAKFPSHPDWTALPDSVMPVVKSEDELKSQTPPVNYRVERMVAERAGINKKASWFDRREHDDSFFPAFLLREDWNDENEQALFWRYINRQAPRLLMLSRITDEQRELLEAACKPYATEISRFYSLYPKLIDEGFINALRVEARIREASGSGKPIGVRQRRDGVLYI